MKFRLSLDTAAVSLLLTLAALVGFVIFIGEQAGVRVRVDLPEDGVVGPYQTITFTFSEAFDSEMASSLIFLDPVQEGYLEWTDTYTLRFTPVQAYQKGVTYRVLVDAGETSSGGREVKQAQTWNFTVREPRVAYLLMQENRNSIWSVNVDGSDPQRLTDETLPIISFDAAQSGDFIIFTSPNENGGVDLWRVSREGGDSSMLLNCGFDRCTTPAISPDGTRIAYSREAAGPTPDIPFGSPRTWVLDLENGQDGPVYADQQILGYNPSWSPDSNKLASFDGLSDTIHLIDFQTGEHFLFASNTGGPVTWSPDSMKFLYTVYAQTDSGGRSQVKLADLSINESVTYIGQKDTYDYSYYSIAWSPLQERAVLSLRVNDRQLTQALWVFNPAMLDGILVASDPEYTYNSPQWDPWGDRLIFQQFKLRGQYQPEIGLWQGAAADAVLLTRGIMPQWLP
mgnify:CR=1 FL=1